MIPLVKRLLNAFLYDEDMGPRWFALGFGGLGGMIANGGALPTTGIVVPVLGGLPPWVGGAMVVVAGAIATITTTLPKPPAPPEPKP